MKANTYVVKPFGISEVKVIALKGDPGTPTQEQINTAVDEYMTEHPEAQIPDGSITEQKLSSDVVDTLNEVDNKADQTGSYPDLIAGTAENLLSSSYQTDHTPYLLRRTPYGAREKGSIVGGSIVWNQLIADNAVSSNSGTKTWDATNKEYTITATNLSAPSFGYYSSMNIAPGHVAFMSEYLNPSVALSSVKFGIASSSFRTIALSAGAYTNLTNVVKNETTSGKSIINYHNLSNLGLSELTIKVKNLFAIDLTLMFGPTIADYLYSVEQATAGAGVALAKAWAGITADYYPYDAGSIKSVTGLTAHRMTDGNGDVIGEYPLDSSLTLRGLPKLDGDSLYYDGDIYNADGTVERRYGVVDLGTLNWSYNNAEGNQYFFGSVAGKALGNFNILCDKYVLTEAGATAGMQDKEIKGHATSRAVFIKDSAYTDATAFKTAMSGVYLVYELAEPTTEQAEPYTALQICDPSGTEEFVGASMPVGHDTQYYADLKGKIEDIPDAPSADGTYTLRVTVSNGVATYSWG